MNMLRPAALLVPVALLLPAASPASGQEAAPVTLGATTFNPPQVTVAPGGTVTWTNSSSADHTITFGDRDEHPTCQAALIGGTVGECMEPGQTESRTFATVGTFGYVCRLHSNNGKGMVGQVIVAAPATTVTTAPAPAVTSTTTATTTTRPPTTTTTRVLATSSTTAPPTSTTTGSGASSTTLSPAEPPAFDPDDPDGTGGTGGTGEDLEGTEAAAGAGGEDEGGNSGPVALIVGMLLAVAAAGGALLWRLRPGRPPGPVK